jgi:hypothetical protein
MAGAICPGFNLGISTGEYIVMHRIPLAAGAIALCLTVPAFAQYGPSASPPAAMSTSTTSTMTCDQMMTQADRMSMSSTGARMTMAQNERHMAFMAKTKNDEASCKMHMEKAMKLMK